MCHGAEDGPQDRDHGDSHRHELGILAGMGPAILARPGVHPGEKTYGEECPHRVEHAHDGSFLLGWGLLVVREGSTSPLGGLVGEFLEARPAGCGFAGRTVGRPVLGLVVATTATTRLVALQDRLDGGGEGFERGDDPPGLVDLDVYRVGVVQLHRRDDRIDWPDDLPAELVDARLELLELGGGILVGSSGHRAEVELTGHWGSFP